jgi:hypothetical protein
VICGFLAMIFYEKKGHWPFMKAKPIPPELQRGHSDSDSQEEDILQEKDGGAAAPSTKIQSIDA